MSQKNEANLKLNADGSKLDSELKKAERNVRTFGSSVKHTFSDVKRAIAAAGETFGTFGKITAAFSSGLILKKLFSLEEFMKVDDALLMMQANLKMTAKELDGFKSKMAAMAGSHGEDMGELFKASSKLSKAYKPNDILKIMDASSMASHAMEQDLTSVQERIVQIMKMYRQTPEEAKKIAEALVASNADMGTLDILLQRGILKGGAGKGYQEVLALASALKKAGAESPRVVMGIESIINTIEDKESTLKKAGIDVFKIDPKTGKKAKKDITEILRELEPVLAKRKKILGDEEYNEKLDKTFGPGAHEALPFLFSQKDVIKKAIDEQGNAAQIAAQRAVKAEEKWSDQLNKIKGNLAAIKTDLSWIYDLGKKPVKFLADSPKLTKGIGYGAAGLSLAVLGGMAYGKGRQFMKNFGKTAVGIAEGKAVEAATGVTPVFVTNWPATFGAGMPGGGVPGGGGKFGTAMNYAGQGIAAIGVGWTIGSLLNMGIDAIGGEEGALGNKIHDWAHRGEAEKGKQIDALLAQVQDANKSGDREKAKQFLNQIKLIVNIEKDGRIRTDSDDTNTYIDIKRGEFTYD